MEADDEPVYARAEMELVFICPYCGWPLTPEDLMAWLADSPMACQKCAARYSAGALNNSPLTD